MAFSATFSQNSFSCLSQLPHNLRRNPLRLPSIRAVKSTEPEKEKTVETKSEESSVSNAQPSTTPPKTPRKPVYSMKKGQIVRVDKEKYLSSVNYLSVGHPPYYKGLDYIYEDRGDVASLHSLAALMKLDGLGSQPHQLGFQQTCLSSQINSITRECDPGSRSIIACYY